MPFLDVILIAFFPGNVFCESLKDHISYTKRVQQIVLMPLGHPTILLKSD